MTLGEKIYKFRTDKNLSQGDLSDMLGVSRQSVSKWENDAATPDLDKIIKLAEVFGTSIDELVKDNAATLPKTEEPQTTVIIKKESAFPPRKIVGTVLFSLSLIITFICFVIGGLEGALSGILFSAPLILCGLVCFIFKKNVGLWCAWAVFFAVDMFLRMATGTSSSVIFNFQALLFYIRGGEFIRLLLSFAQFAAILSLILITVFRFWKLPLENKKLPVIFWGIYAAMRIALAFFSASHLYRQIMNYVLSTMNTWIYTLSHSLYVWIYTGFFIAAVVLTVRYFYTRKHKSL
ncbi:MAG: helix-turn-helix transcriptional regulator [Oscillospiraceae bacterium]|nr:helix-turn-helix transcriptional regulator [Oscillospiraceae bacterium]